MSRDECHLSSYAELIALLDALPVLARERRRRDRLSVRAAAEQAGCNFATLSRWERGQMGRSVSLVRSVLLWLDSPAQPALARPTGDPS